MEYGYEQSESFRRRRDEEWDIAVLDYGHAVTAEEIDSAVREAIIGTGAEIILLTGHAAFRLLPDDL
ncbi:hypothetical protein [Nocardia bovistercoris]|uniref:Uncharacterized protein n=1 Tax=Nocardia bovistercoris TaxID=2785916 RepID=A0A931IIJ0_9NOCA|nr:hypothetical protein [Nocardia bovistercoris]MBH0780990.1 hypothetical protein [Nocardia bovistercoris]